MCLLGVFLKEKIWAKQVFQSFYSMIKTQFNTNIQILRTDDVTKQFNSLLWRLFWGLIHWSSCVITPQQNVVSERKNHHILEVAQSLLFTSHVPKYFLGDDVLTAWNLINRMSSQALNYKSPLHCLSHLSPENRSFSDLDPKVFGCSALFTIIISANLILNLIKVYFLLLKRVIGVIKWKTRSILFVKMIFKEIQIIEIEILTNPLSSNTLYRAHLKC